MKKHIAIPAWLVVLTLLAISLSACSGEEPKPLKDVQEEPPAFAHTWMETADSLQEATYLTYLSTNGTFRQNNTGNNFFNYWWNAHMLDAMVDGYLRTGNAQYKSRMKALLHGIKVMNSDTYHNVFNDDMEWLGMACLRAYAATGDAEYLAVAHELWTEIKKSWSDIFEGGISWKTDTPYEKNACANAPAAILALRLYQVDRNPEDLQWAKDIYSWQKSTLVDPATGLVWDNISMQEGEVVINKDWIFTYNLGTYLGAAQLLYEITHEQSYLQDAVQTARSSMTSPKVTSEGLLRDEGQGDGGLFKGIFVRYFTELILQPDLNETTRQELVKFMKFNAETFYDKGIGRPSMLSSPDWRQQPGASTDLSTQLSGLMLIEAAARLAEEEIL